MVTYLRLEVAFYSPHGQFNAAIRQLYRHLFIKLVGKIMISIEEHGTVDRKAASIRISHIHTGSCVHLKKSNQIHGCIKLKMLITIVTLDSVT